MADQSAGLRSIDQVLIKAASNIRKVPQSVHSVFGYDYADGIVNDPNYRAKLYPAPGETYDQWVERVDKELPGFSALTGKDNSPQGAWKGDQQGMQRSIVANGLKKGGVEGLSETDLKNLRDNGGFADPNNLGQAEDRGQGAQAADQASAEQLLREFSAAMMKPPDMNDPYVRKIAMGASNNAQESARMRGLNGGYAVGNSEQATANALAGVGQQRQQMGLQALQGAGQLGMQEAQLQTQNEQFKYQAMLQQQAGQYQAGLGQAQGTGAMIGGIGGGIIGGIYGGPAGAQAGMTAGSQLGGAVGGMGYGPRPSAPSYNYAPASRSGGTRYGSY